MDTMIDRLNYQLAEYMASEGHTMRPPTIEEGHTKACLAYATQCVLENLRDAEDVTDHEFNFRLNAIREEAIEYLNAELVDCRCPKRYEEDSHYLRLRRQLASGEWTTDIVWMNLSDAVVTLSDDIEYGYARKAWIGLHDLHDEDVHPCLWASLNYRADITG